MPPDTTEITTREGIALSPSGAAACIDDVHRTRKFIRGIHAAIRDALTRKARLRVLYVGPGPYGTLLTPLLALWGPLPFEQVDLVEINPQSARTLARWLDTLDFPPGRLRLHEGSLLEFAPEAGYDLIVCEVMARALTREPQVALTRHARQFLAPRGIFIPEEIRLSWAISSQGKEPEWPDRYPHAGPEHPCGAPLGVLSMAQDIPATTAVEVERRYHPGQELLLFTTVKAYGEEELKEGESLITNPLCVFSNFRRFPSRLYLDYITGRLPGWRVRED